MTSNRPRGVVRHRRDPRAVVSLRARYRSPTVFEFVENECYDLSRGGMFMATGSPAAVGTLIKFECEVDEGRRHFSGVGRVLWTRAEEEQQQDKPAGMAVKFVRLDEGAAELVDHMVHQHGALGEGYLARQEVRDSQRTSRPVRKGSDAPPVRSSAPPHADKPQSPPARQESEDEAARATDEGMAAGPEPSPASEPAPSDASRTKENAAAADGNGASRAPKHEPDEASRAETAAERGEEPSEATPRGDTESPSRSDHAPGEAPLTPGRSEPPSMRRYTPVLLAVVVALLMGVWVLLSEDVPEEPPEHTSVATAVDQAPGQPTKPPAEPTKPSAELTKPPAPDPAVDKQEPTAEPESDPTTGADPAQDEETPAEPKSDPTTVADPARDEETPTQAPADEAPEVVAKPEVRILSEPEGATLEVDGEQVGKTPFTVELPAGEPVAIVLTKEGYQRLTDEVDVDAEQDELVFELQPVAEDGRYLLHVITTPPRARVTANDVSDVAPSHFRTVDFSEPVKVLASKKGYRDTAAIVRPEDFEEKDGVLEHRIYLRLKKE